MADMEYKPNSHRFREQQSAVANDKKRVEKVVRGTAKVKKKNDLHKVADIFISEDAKNVKEYVLMDILVPTVKKVIMGTIDMLLNGGSGKYDYSGRSSGSKVSYARYYDDRKDNRRYAEPSKTRARFDHDDIIFPTRGDAEAVREEMCNVIERYGFVTVADMYDMAHLTQPYTSEKYGWTNLHTADVLRVSEGYIIKLPKIEPLEK